MSERDLIKRRMETIRGTRTEADMHQKSVDAHWKAQDAAKDARVSDMERYARRFAKWARRHNIPYDYHAGGFRTKGRWVLASFSTDDSGIEKSSGSLHNLHVNKRGKIQPRHYPLNSGVNRDHIARFSPDHVLQRVAELCVEHGLKAPNL